MDSLQIFRIHAFFFEEKQYVQPPFKYRIDKCHVAGPTCATGPGTLESVRPKLPKRNTSRQECTRPGLRVASLVDLP